MRSSIYIEVYCRPIWEEMTAIPSYNVPSALQSSNSFQMSLNSPYLEKNAGLSIFFFGFSICKKPLFPSTVQDILHFTASVYICAFLKYSTSREFLLLFKSSIQHRIVISSLFRLRDDWCGTIVFCRLDYFHCEHLIDLHCLKFPWLLSRSIWCTAHWVDIWWHKFNFMLC